MWTGQEVGFLRRPLCIGFLWDLSYRHSKFVSLLFFFEGDGDNGVHDSPLLGIELFLGQSSSQLQPGLRVSKHPQMPRDHLGDQKDLLPTRHP